MKISVTEEMRDALRIHAREKRSGTFGSRVVQALRLTRLVAQAVEEAQASETSETKLDCHDAYIWTCQCGRTVCTQCEGTTDQPDLCDDCWADAVKQAEKEAGDA